MKSSFTILILILMVLLPLILTDIQPLIQGGELAKIEDFPWQVGIVFWPGYFNCGGFVISKWYVLTAAFCFDGERVDEATIIFGSEKAADYSVDPFLTRKVSELFIHPMYDRKSIIPRYDIALIVVDQNIEFSEKIKPISFPSQKIDNLHLYPARVSGYGRDINSENNLGLELLN